MIDQRKRNIEIDQAIGNRIRAIRISNGKTQDDLANAADMTLADYSRSEAGERRFNAVELFAISQALGVGLADIVSALER
ncbi:helix-turn-helix domain-containing protein [Hyphomicrobium sp. MC1]|jgi:transcriptional regulator with XRE-family HTH domain|uniref:helix-turn-helix domain-containing protein n=1 Tax=unclassified Hyphomicrobium TaxID=2619925 RepID=UPI000213D832|nr:helix-turn-helix transcriptional regulator [Hyphomicrobium sp. MC1]CCB65068.1 protein of unknown function [Hyphomicrobium sp. MC1]